MPSKIKKRFYVGWHGFWYWLNAPGFVSRAILAAVSFSLIALPIYKLGWRYGVLGTLVWAGTGLFKAWRELSPRHMQLLQRNYLQRKLALYRVLQIVQRDKKRPGAKEAEAYQQEVLQLIVSYVRDHRLDTSASTIFANLLVVDGADFVVAARDRPHRNGLARYPMRSLLAAKVFESGQPHLVGDLYSEFPDTIPGKPYCSILAIPVKLGPVVVGVVSIDSTRKYHFDLHFRDLVEYLNPYVCLLAWTIAAPSPKLPGEKAVPRLRRK